MATSLFRLLLQRRCQPFEGIPGPEPTFPIGNLFDFLSVNPWERCADYANRYGGLTQVWLGTTPALVLNDPKLIADVLVDRWQDYYKDMPVEALKPVITEESLFISNLPSWEEKRHADPLESAVGPSWLAEQTGPMQRAMMGQVEQWQRNGGGECDLYDAMQRLMFFAFGQAFWGCDVPADRYDWFQTLARQGTRRMNPGMPLFTPLSPWFWSARGNWYRTFQSMVEDARSQKSSPSADLLHVSVRKGVSLTTERLAESLATNFFGGVFSASSTVNSALYLLARHPAEADQLRNALREIRPADGEWTSELLNGCRRLDFVLREAMRYYPAVPLYFRNSACDRSVVLDGRELPPNTLLMISNWWLHKSSPHWVEPERFWPDRWDHGVAEANPFGSDYFFPFGRGPRQCIGASFAIASMKLALAILLAETEVRLDPAQAYRQAFFFGVMMPKGLLATVQPRPAA